MHSREKYLQAHSITDIKKHINENVEKGYAFWNQEQNKKRKEIIDGMPYEFHYLPSLSHKIHTHNHSENKQCFLCNLEPEKSIALTNPTPSTLRINSYPFMDNHTILGERKHTAEISLDHLIEVFRICNRYKLNSAFSTHGSGASFPEHSHSHLFTTRIPLYDLQPIWFKNKPVKIGTLNQYPASILVLESKKEETLARQIAYLLQDIQSNIYSYNLQYDGKHNRAFFFPRQTDASNALGGIVLGVTTVSGLFQPDARGYSGHSIEEALEIIEKRYLSMNGHILKKAIQELVFPQEFNFDVIMPNIRKP